MLFILFDKKQKKKERKSSSLLSPISWQCPTLPRKEYAVPSAQEDLTSVFGMDTGVTPPPLSPGNLSFFSFFSLSSSLLPQDSLKTTQCITFSNPFSFLGQALDLLVSVSSMYHYTYTPDLSTRSSLWCLTSSRNGKSHLKVRFALRCFQRLSIPDLATQLCLWRDNWFTSGLSNPVLSY